MGRSTLFQDRSLGEVTYRCVFLDAPYGEARGQPPGGVKAMVIALEAPPTVAAKCWASTSATPRTGRSGPRSCAAGARGLGWPQAGDQRRPRWPEGRDASAARRDLAGGRTHYAVSLMALSRRRRGVVKGTPRSICNLPDAGAVHAQFERAVDALTEKLPTVADHLEERHAPTFTAFTAFPTGLWRQIWSHNPAERLHREFRGRIDINRHIPGRISAIRLIGAAHAEQHDEGPKTVATSASTSSPGGARTT